MSTDPIMVDRMERVPAWYYWVGDLAMLSDRQSVRMDPGDWLCLHTPPGWLMELSDHPDDASVQVLAMVAQWVYHHVGAPVFEEGQVASMQGATWSYWVDDLAMLSDHRSVRMDPRDRLCLQTPPDSRWRMKLRDHPDDAGVQILAIAQRWPPDGGVS